MGNVQMEARQIRYGSTNVEEAIKNGGGISDRVTALEETVGDETGGLVKDVSDLETDVSKLNANVYSSEEVKIGTWDGADLFRKKISGTMPNNTETGFETGLSNVTVRYLYGMSENDIGFGTIPYPVEGPNGVGTVRAYYKKSDNKVYISTSEPTIGTFEIVLEYTKNTDQNNR